MSAAALEVPVRVVDDAAGLRGGWAGASVRLLGVDSASRWGLVGPGDAFVVGSSGDDLARCSSELMVPVVPLPDRSGRLSAVISDAVREGSGRGTVVAILGASGASGRPPSPPHSRCSPHGQGSRRPSSTLRPAAAGSTCSWVRRGRRHPLARSCPGPRGAGRHHRRAAACPGCLHPVPGEGEGAPPAWEGVEVVLASLTRAVRFAFVDVGRGPAPARIDLAVLLVGADVSSIAAAQALGAATRPRAHRATRAGRSIPAEVVGRTLGIECMGVLGEHRALPRLAELGLPPLPGPARRYAREVSAVLRRVRDA
ncbi:hypothetical protein G7085_14520 [Tessaracoccus sp. HDW20]|uniref:hypothetical protein n=1 Tax=Tessaracoccus coleopterorum TaxID=2714950 RepID=UPI0018D47E37|nr:hypothetical protein [Tessaracoccus coleopterorum]NHB85422.1 hypothetical protein [Tessaracoccus coleopterorum]